MHEHHPDPIEQNIETHPAKLAVFIVVGAVAMIVGIILLAQFAVGAYGGRSMKDDPSMSPDAVARRIAPVAHVAIDPSAPAKAAGAVAPKGPAVVVAAVAIPPPAAGAASAADKGKAVYDAACSACHNAGVANAPKLGDKAAWALRAKAGKDALYASALKGKGAMPAKGGAVATPDADVKAAVDYLLAKAK